LQNVAVSEVQSCFEALERTALEEMAGEDIPAHLIRFERALELRYAIQKYELAVPVESGALTENDRLAWRKLFDERHEQHYGTRADDQKVEIVNYRLTARVPLPKPEPQPHPLHGESAAPAYKGSRRAYFDGWIDCPVYAREELGHGNRLAGPTIIEQVDSTIVIHPGQSATVDRFGNVVIEVTR
jgi:N-methylhydantoinase A